MMLPVPSSVWLPLKYRPAPALPDSMLTWPPRTRPLTTIRSAPFTTMMFALTVRPLRVPSLLVVSNCEPPEAVSVPPSIVPPLSRHEPVLASRLRPPLSVPLMLMVEALKVQAPRVGLLNVPLRFTIALVPDMPPVLFQLPFRFAVALLMMREPLLLRLLMVSVPAVAWIVPELVTDDPLMISG